MKKLFLNHRLTLVLLLCSMFAGVLLSGCSTTSAPPIFGNNNGNGGVLGGAGAAGLGGAGNGLGGGVGAQTPPVVFVQVEELARPAINEGLVTNNADLNAFNSILPNQQVAALGGPVGTDIVATLTALGNNAARVNDIATAFVPDVMRIDTAIASGLGVTAYSNAAVPVGVQGVVMPRAGRKLEDDVMDITITVLTNSALTTDNVSYCGPGGNPGQGHHPLNGQVGPCATGNAATFPFLAPAN